MLSKTTRENMLHIACYDGEAKLVQSILEEGTDPDCFDIHRQTPLMKASLKGHLEVVVLLLKSGANPNATNVSFD